MDNLGIRALKLFFIILFKKNIITVEPRYKEVGYNKTLL